MVGVQHGGEALEGLPVAMLLQRHVHRQLRHLEPQPVQPLGFARDLRETRPRSSLTQPASSCGRGASMCAAAYHVCRSCLSPHADGDAVQACRRAMSDSA